MAVESAFTRMKPTMPEQADLVPPYIVRFLARENRRLLTTSEIARRAGLSATYTRRVTRLSSWRSVDIGTAHAFAAACKHDLLRPRRSLQYIARFLKTGRGFAHLNPRQLARFVKLLE